ncbi:MAG: hypothetical protein HY791_30145 [Deltaproteobacteria bacterium]|nr:hypothetical protein [Deltaproteobacteria bacterium]
MIELRRLAALMALVLATSAARASADELPPASPLGLGIILGDPTGFTLKSRLTNRNALQVHLGFGFEGKHDNGRVTFILDYLFHLAGVGLEGAGTLAPYVGVGGKLAIIEGNDNILFGVRVPLGLAFFIKGAPIEIAVEVAVGIHVIPETRALVDGGLMGRYYF